jgi:asparagine synthase (glutamine-hydrolysing)
VCGILGHFAFGSGRADGDLWRRLVNTIGHRGPDDSSFWQDGRFTFGHRRLSIIDLSDGHQPMATEDASLVITFNGEIYNYIELRDELAGRGCRFRTMSDTEVLLHGYRHWGDQLPSKLRGMFVFAIADRRRQELFVARDRFGEKPLLYADYGGGIAFASELKAIAALPDARREINDEALAAFLCLNYVPGTATMLGGVNRLAPATWRRWTADGLSQTAVYWAPPSVAPDLDLPMDEAVDRLESLLDASTRFALRSDVPVSLFLSGGIDSSLVARSAARSGKFAAAYCLTFGDRRYSEWPKAEATARQLGVPLVEVPLGPEALEDFLGLVDHADEPLADSSGLAVWTLSRAVAKHAKVVLSGDGGDELFAGYLTYQATRWHGAVSSRLPLRGAIASAGGRMPTSEGKVSASYKLWRFLRAVDLPPSVAHFTWNGTWLPADARRLSSGALRGLAGDALTRLAAGHGLPVRPTLRQLQIADVQEYLPNDILTKSDRMSMAHGLEVRAPFLDPDLAEFALRLPEAMKLPWFGAGKRVLRRLAERTYGAEVSNAAKQGFSIPVHAWLRGPARPLVEDLLSEKALSDIPRLDAAAVRAAVADHMTGRRSYGFELWGLMVLSAWHRRFIRAAYPIPAGPAPREVHIAARETVH